MDQSFKKSILIVEDEPDIRVLYSTLLESEGYEVIQAADGEEALMILDGDKPFDLVYLDLNMPKVDGWGVLYAIQEKNLRTKIHKVALLTNNVLDSLRDDEIHRLKIDAYYVKSDMDPPTFIQRTHSLLTE
jgi:CheY-like chemotaxis protein